MTQPIISVRNVGKEYRLGEHTRSTTLRDAISGMFSKNAAAGIMARRKARHIWALKNISFDVAEGEVLGIVGANGAGKSTLLKILSRITEPTIGEIDLRGRVASLLEVGTGFNDELTGRENIILNGAILGMSKREIDKKFDEIVDFSGVERFIDTPVKHYSSGMKMRLAFAVAAHLEPEILIIDEVLAVGDAEFQRKCLGKMNDVARAGRTVLFVSHNLVAVESLCNTCMLLEQGQISSIGPVGDIVRAYMRSVSARQSDVPLNHERSVDAGSIALTRVLAQTANGGSTGRFASGDDIVLTAEFNAQIAHKVRLAVAFLVTNENGVLVYKCYSNNQHREPIRISGPCAISCVIHKARLAPGAYQVSIRVFAERDELFSHDDVAAIEIAGADLYETGKLSKPPMGVYLPEVQWVVKPVLAAAET